jgi:hypothetical protein
MAGGRGKGRYGKERWERRGREAREGEEIMREGGERRRVVPGR